ncbi:MAG: FAD-dependent oxidoreductase, partial [Acidimicrobiia bacterium]|nr:FAD-dependent oxidoreductase [Acidimicrobiia bacterium]
MVAPGARRGRSAGRSQVRVRRLWLDDDPATALQFAGQAFRRDAPQCLLGGGQALRLLRRRASSGLGDLIVAVGGSLQLLDERGRLVTRELAAGLALREPHRPTGVAEIAVPGVLQQRQQFADLLRGGRRAGGLAERHATVSPHRGRDPRPPRNASGDRPIGYDPPLVDTDPFDRGEALRRLADEEFDVLVIGAGATGAGVALDAASRGLRTALVERGDFAAGTSSLSSKMIHGGIRYLQQLEIKLVYQSLTERQRLLANAPHLVRTLPFVMPIYTKGGLIPKMFARMFGLVLWFYDVTGGSRIGHRHRRLDRDETVAHMPTLRTERIHSGYLYYDAQVDDARMTMAIARTAATDHGAVVANHTPVVALNK